MYVCNAFSLKMLPEWVAVGLIGFQRLTLEEARAVIARAIEDGDTVTSTVGHADTAAIFSTQLGVDVPMNRVDARFIPGIEPTMLVGQYYGPRLPEGATALPEGAEIQWLLISFDENGIIEFTPDVWNGGDEK